MPDIEAAIPMAVFADSEPPAAAAPEALPPMTIEIVAGRWEIRDGHFRRFPTRQIQPDTSFMRINRAPIEGGHDA